ncbi:hypothetical protein ACOJBM_29210 [Rhizobium beringeri]|uniref:hypothetical protein n=1 Tax=Rhizobium beringeri TaxID=3019934 RepID=UPI003B5C757E
MTQKSKGSATAPTVPSHGSIIPTKEMKMNSTTFSSSGAIIPAPEGDGVGKIAARENQTYEMVRNMENPLWTIHDILTAVGMIVVEMEGDDTVAAVQRLVSIAQQQFKEAEELRGQIFHLNHPFRDELAKERRHEA